MRHHDHQTVFAEQWHAQVIAVVDLLIAQGSIDASEWSRELGAELDRRASDGEPDTDANYYDAFLAILGSVLESRKLATSDEIDKRKGDWREAYLNTPHGSPVHLKS